VGAEHDSHSGEDSSEGARPSTDAQGDRTQEESKANFIGESWYASYVLATSAAGHSELHKPMKRRPSSQASPAELQPGVTPTEMIRPSGLPAPQLTERLLEAYFKRFHVFCPILERAAFLSSVRDGTVSITLLRSVLFVASIHCDPEVFHLMGYSTRLDAGDDLFNKACASWNADRESDRTTMVLSSYLNHYFFGRPSEYRDTLWWLGNAIRSAQCMGYHRSTKNSKMSSTDKSRWKRVWWCLYVGIPWLFLQC
jgi:hypothetical protein